MLRYSIDYFDLMMVSHSSHIAMTSVSETALKVSAQQNRLCRFVSFEYSWSRQSRVTSLGISFDLFKLENRWRPTFRECSHDGKQKNMGRQDLGGLGRWKEYHSGDRVGELMEMGRHVSSQINASQASQEKQNLILASGSLGLETLGTILIFVQTFNYKSWVWSLSC